MRGGHSVHLTPIQYALLVELMKAGGKVVTHRRLLCAARGPAHTGDTQYLRVYVRQLRRKIEKDPERPQYLLTETGIGYRLRAPD